MQDLCEASEAVAAPEFVAAYAPATTASAAVSASRAAIAPVLPFINLLLWLVLRRCDDSGLYLLSSYVREAGLPDG